LISYIPTQSIQALLGVQENDDDIDHDDDDDGDDDDFCSNYIRQIMIKPEMAAW